MKKEASELRKTCLERLFESSRKETIAKAIVVENNHIYAYGYDRVHKA